jgi:hypothetical protein
MTTMGRHSPPIDGTIANGHQLVPLAPAALQKHGPVSALQQPAAPDAAGQARTAPNGRERRKRPDGDTVIRVLAAIVVLAVAAFAAIISYSHIFELGRHHGQDGTAARLLPLSVDGLIASASLFMLYAARNGIVLRKLSWPRVMLWLGIGATVAANVLYGAPFGWLSAVVSAWPAVAFVGSVEMAVRFVRDARHDGGDGGASEPAVAPAVTPRHDKRDDKPPRKAAPRKPAAAMTKQARAAAILRDNPGLKNRELEALTDGDIDVRTFQRARNGRTGSTT